MPFPYIPKVDEIRPETGKPSCLAGAGLSRVDLSRPHDGLSRAAFSRVALSPLGIGFAPSMDELNGHSKLH